MNSIFNAGFDKFQNLNQPNKNLDIRNFGHGNQFELQILENENDFILIGFLS